MSNPAPQPAPDIETLFDFENAIEPAIKTRLASQSIPAFCQNEVDDLPPRRVDIQLALGKATGAKMKVPGAGMTNRAWAYRLTIGICTPRTSEPGATPPRLATDHGRFRGRVRWLMQYFADQFGPDVLPYHVLTSIVDESTAPSVVSADDCDLSELTFSGILSIRDGAWPPG